MGQVGLSQIHFNEHLINDDTHGIGAIFACDLDKDLDQDILAACLEDHQIIWFRNDGGNPLKWEKIIIASNVYSAHSVAAADFDKDGDLDVVGAAYSGAPGIAWFRNDGGDPVVWTKLPVAVNFVNAHEVYVCDLDKDQDDDILGASSDLNSVAWWRNDGGDPIIWTEQVFSEDVTLAKTVSAADFDQDGNTDVVSASIIDNTILWWRNDGGEPIKWTEFLIDGNFIGGHRVQSIDMDNDGDDDILGAGYLGHQIAWWRNDGGDTLPWTKIPIASGITNACIALATDLNNDNDLDVVATAQGLNKIFWWRNDGNQSTSWTKFDVEESFTRPWPLFAGDIDGDSDIDIISGSSHNGSNEIKWWENDFVSAIDESPLKNRLHIFPNPAKNTITIEGLNSSDKSIQLRLTDSFGKTVASISIPGSILSENFTFNFDGQASGIYFLSISGSTTNVSKKLVVNPK
jgi:Secretion system C-terminal sorting domain/FG-GAP-like repeat